MECGGLPRGEYLPRIVVTNPAGEVRAEAQLRLVVDEVRDPSRGAGWNTLPVTVDQFGRWQVEIQEGGRRLAVIHLRIKRTGEA